MRIGRTLPPAAATGSRPVLAYGIAAAAGRDPRPRIEEELKQFLGVRHAFLVSSGKAGLFVALRALHALSGRRRVVMPAYTCFSVPSAVVRAGLEPVACDVDPETLDFDPRSLTAAIDDRTLCVIATHLFGFESDLRQVRTLCRRAGAFLIDDAAQALGCASTEGHLGTLGDAGIYSLGRGKGITVGEGGIVVSNVDAVAERVAEQVAAIDEPAMLANLRHVAEFALLRLFIQPQIYWFPASLPFLHLGETRFDPDFPVERLSRARAGMLRGWQADLETANRERAENAGEMRHALDSAVSGREARPYSRLPILVGSRAERQRIADASRREGLGVTPMYPTPISDIPQIRGAFADQDFPGARDVADRLLTIPTHRFVRRDDRERIVKLVNDSASVVMVPRIQSASAAIGASALQLAR